MGEDPMKIQHHFCDIFAKEPLSKNNYFKKIKKPRQRDILHNNWPQIFRVQANQEY